MTLRSWPRLLLMLFVGIGLGCSSGNDRETYPVTGTVTLNGKPLPQGTIEFHDPDGEGRAAAADIRDGKFQCQSEPGSRRIVITSLQETGTQYNEAMQTTVSIKEQVIPAKYNSQTELTAMLAPDAALNELQFELLTPTTGNQAQLLGSHKK